LSKKILLILILITLTILLSSLAISCKKPIEELLEESTSIDTNEIPSEEISKSEEKTIDHKITIAIISPMIEHPWYQRCKEGAIRAGDDLEIEIIFEAPQEVDAEKQLSIFNNMVEKKVNAILISAIDPELLKKPISDAILKGIPVFGFDAGAPETDILFLASGLEPKTTGKMIGEGLAKEIDGKGKVALLTSILDQPDLKERREAIIEVLEQYLEIEILGIYANENDFVKGITQCQSLLETYPNLAGFASDVELGIPTSSQAVVDKGLGGKVAIWGIGMPEQNSEFIKNDIIRGVLTLDPAKMTYIGVVTAYRYLKENTLPKVGNEFGWVEEVVIIPEEKTIYAPPLLLTPENVDEFDF